MKSRDVRGLPFVFAGCILAILLGLLGPSVALAEERDADHDRDDRLRRFESFAPAGTPLPDRAQVIPWQEFRKQVLSGELHLVSPNTIKREAMTFARRDRANRRFVQRYLEQHPDLTALAQIVSAMPRPGEGVTSLPDGGWLIHPRELQHPIASLGESAKFANLARSIRWTNSRRAQLSLYTDLFGRLPAGIGAGPNGAPPPAPESLADANIADLKSALNDLATNWRTIAGAVQLAGPEITFLGCDFERGASGQKSDGSGRDTGASCSPRPDSIYANFDFPMKQYLTCAKDQGNRETCHTFGATSAVEELTAFSHGIAVNLSEEDLMEHYRLVWAPGLYHETGDSFEEITDAITNGYTLPYEDRWDYNPSFSRVTLSNGFYEHSCDGYPNSEPCSDTAPQPPLFCSVLDGDFYCAFEEAGIAESPYGPAFARLFWDTNNPELSAEYMILQLAFGNAVVISINTTDAFYNSQFTGAAGVIHFDAHDVTTNNGGHVVHVVSFVSNEDLAKKLPAIPASSGPGYFIVKNSWSSCYGDGGYVYMDWEYAKAVITQGYALQSVK